MITSEEIIRWQSQAVVHWHQGGAETDSHPIESLAALGLVAPDPLLRAILVNHDFNFRLWHEEDLARDRRASDAEIAAVKRRIDGLNQHRNDAIERIDQTIAESLIATGAIQLADAGLSTETPGAAIDRLSILALRVFHYAQRAQALENSDASERTDPSEPAGDSEAAVGSRIVAAWQTCLVQQRRLGIALDQLLTDIVAGRRRHDVFQQLKMYNDPALNPLLADDRQP